MSKYRVSFGYRYSDEYERGFRSRVKGENFELRKPRLLDYDTVMRKIKDVQFKPAGTGLKLIVCLLQVRLFCILWNTIMLYREFKDRKIDVLHINNGGYPGASSCIAAVFAARLLHIKPVVFVVNNIAADYSHPHRWLDRPLDRSVSGGVDLFVTGSDYAGRALKKVLDLPDAKLRNIHNGILPRQVTESREDVKARLGIDEKTFTVAVVALLEKRKGHIYLLSALEHLKEQGGELPCVLIEGSGPECQELEDYVLTRQLSRCVKFIGTEKNIFDLMNAVDCVILPSISNEDFPNVVLEAMSLGKPVIATSIAGIPEQIEHMRSGILVEPRDHVAIAESIQKLMSDRSLRQSIGENASSSFYSRFTAGYAVSRYCEIYEDLLRSRN